MTAIDNQSITTNVIYNEDCYDVLKRLPDSSVDLMLTDIPYSCTWLEWDQTVDLKKMWGEWERVVKSNGAFIFTATQPFTTDLINSNRKLFKYDLVWSKVRTSGFFNAKQMPLRAHENILVFYNKLPVYNPIMTIGEKFDKTKHNGKKVKQDVLNGGEVELKSKKNDGPRYPVSIIEFSQNWTRQQQLHNCQKPVSMMEYFIKTYSNDGDIVFDGYCGSGTLAVAAKLTNRKYICCELDKKFYDISVKRVEETIVPQKEEQLTPVEVN